MDGALRNFVSERASFRCEYCTVHQNDDPLLLFQVDRIVAGQHGGTYAPENTALSCHRCNLKKGTNLSGLDPQDGTVISLFNPRTETWSEHFAFQGPVIIGLTQTGRATVQTLAMNDERQLKLRTALGYPDCISQTN